MNLKQYRKAKKMTQEEAARKLGCSVSTISQVEHGNRFPSRRMARKWQKLSKGAMTARELLGIS